MLFSLSIYFFSVEVGQGKKKNTKQKSSANHITNKQVVKKTIRRLQTHKKVGKNTSTVKDKHVKNAVGE